MTLGRRRSSWVMVTGVAVASLALTACSAGSLGSSSGGSGTTITFLVDNSDTGVAQGKALADGFHKKNSDITVKVETRPGGADGDNLIKTRLSTQSMDDVFSYNSGSLFQQIDPKANLLPLTDEPFVKDVDESFKPQVSVGDEVYGVPQGTPFGGGVLYNLDVYKQLGLQVPKTWDDFIANSEKIKAAGIAPIIQTYQDTWTSQLFVLGDFHNVSAAEPNWADDYTKNKVHYADDPVALAGFEHLQQAHDQSLVNSDFASLTNAQGLQMLADGKGAQYPMLSAVTTGLFASDPSAATKIGFFALPGADAASNGMTTWFPNGIYVPKTVTGDKLDAVKKFLAYVASKDGCDAITSVSAPNGPYLIKGCTLPSDVPQVTKDVVAYFDDDAQSPALEFLSPVKGPNLEQICVQVGSGISDAKTGAEQYDQDVKKQAQQLGLPGW
jgi:raffinose/stachyose/melibiose transport system substrate-binding protein